MLSHARVQVLISHSSSPPDGVTLMPSGGAGGRRFFSPGNKREDGEMGWVCFTHSAMIGSRDRPCSEYRFPPNELPYCFSRATARMDAREANFAASVAVTPWARARSHSLWLVASATTRRSTGWLIPPGWGAQEGVAGRAEGVLMTVRS